MEIDKEKLIPYIERLNYYILEEELHPEDAFRKFADENLSSKNRLTEKELIRVYNKSYSHCSKLISNQFREGTLKRNQKDRIYKKQVARTDRKLMYSQQLTLENKIQIEASKLYYKNKNISVLFFELCKTFDINPSVITDVRYQILVKVLEKLEKG